jgi:hypothetical protein
MVMLQPPAPSALAVREELPEPTRLKSKCTTEPSVLCYGNYVSLSYGKWIVDALDHFLLWIYTGRSNI